MPYRRKSSAFASSSPCRHLAASERSASGTPGSGFGLIACRNVLIYFDRASQERLFDHFHAALAPGGFLVLGMVETLFGDARRCFETVDARTRIFRRL